MFHSFYLFTLTLNVIDLFSCWTITLDRESPQVIKL